MFFLFASSSGSKSLSQDLGLILSIQMTLQAIQVFLILMAMNFCHHLNMLIILPLQIRFMTQRHYQLRKLLSCLTFSLTHLVISKKMKGKFRKNLMITLKNSKLERQLANHGWRILCQRKGYPQDEMKNILFD